MTGHSQVTGWLAGWLVAGNMRDPKLFVQFKNTLHYEYSL